MVLDRCPIALALGLALFSAASSAAELPPAWPSRQYSIGQGFSDGIAKLGVLLGRRSFAWSAGNGGVGLNSTAPIPGVSSGGYWPSQFNDYAFHVNGQYLAQYDLAWFQAHHPSWILYQCDRHTVAFNPLDVAHANVPLDVALRPVRVWIEGYLGLYAAAGYQGIDMDVVQAGNTGRACGHYRGGVWEQQFSGEWSSSVVDERWASAVTDFQREIAAYVHALGGYVIGNTFVGATADGVSNPALPYEKRLAVQFDIVGQESPFMNCKDSTVDVVRCVTLTDSRFDQMFQSARWISHRRGWWLIEYPPCRTGDDDRYSCTNLGRRQYQAFQTAVWLLLRPAPDGNPSYWSPIGFLADDPDYSEHARYVELGRSWMPDVGDPIEPGHLTSGGCYQRLFSAGRSRVVLNRSSTVTCSYFAPARAVDQFGDRVPSGVRTLPPMAAVVVIAP